MTYKLDSLIGKIRCPVICITETGRIAFENGEKAVEYPFGKHYLIESIDIDDGKVIVELAENLLSGDISWSYDSNVSLFDGS